MFVTCFKLNFEAMKKLFSTLFLQMFIIYLSFAGERVEGARISLIKIDNNEVWAMNHTGENGEFVLCQIPPGNYLLTINIPITSFTFNEKEKEKLDKLIDGGCEKEKGRMVFKLNDNCFVFDINCEEQTSSQFKPKFNITKQDSGYLLSIATAEIKKPFDLKGIFQSLTVQFYEKCLESGKFKLQEEMSGN
jgi:hypothetical protein